MSRTCARPGCSRSAVATLAYDYSGGTVVLEDLAGDPHPMVHDLCGTHAEGLRVPLGWHLADNRSQGVGRSPDVGLDLVGA